jgi:DNA repair exonuclease SbcCD nuclease subunit
VLVAGDLVDQNSGYFTVLGLLMQGLHMLAIHGIPVYAIAGNHHLQILFDMAATLRNPVSTC